ncbi:DUF1616 domain-containing protein [Halosimplex halophilum]|uniref:DUF1616 domain-containing protein n=1 Tax=Halosimplex halophilum TaxID=2559572 RepID=UPI00107F0E27|nr:DUF1616 domain-containing protein [Halosimplex halophilum]
MDTDPEPAARPVSGYQVDLVGAAVYTVVAVAVALVPGLDETALRPVIAVGFGLFLPGYAFVAGLFPAGGTVSLTARLVFSLAASLALLPLVGVALHVSPFAITGASALIATVALTLASLAVANRRREALPPDERFRLGPALPFDPTALLASEGRAESLVNGLVLVSLLVAAVSVSAAVTVQPPAERYTEFAVLGENETGDPSATAYPRWIDEEDGAPVYVSLGNHHQRAMDYTVVVTLSEDASGSGETIDRFGVELAPGERTQLRRTLSPPTTGRDLRLTFLLYRGDPPADPSRSTARQDLQLVVDVY